MVFNSIDLLRNSSVSPQPNEVCTLLGYGHPGDGGGGELYWDAISIENDNDGTIIKAIPATGRWKRIYDSDIHSKWFGIKGDGSDDTSKLTKLLTWLPDGSTLDFSYSQIALYTSVVGSTTNDAVPLGQTIRIFNKRNIILKNGTLFVANPGSSASKCRFPSTFTIDGCQDIRLENMLFFAKGQSFGDSDASASLSTEARREFLAKNGGHALVVIRSKHINITDCKCYFAGSVGSLYLSSSYDVKVSNCHSNPASLGYAAYAVDAWCGAASVAGVPDFRTFINNCTAYAETLNAGSSVYCGKGGVFIEDVDVITYVNGGYFADMYANGSNNDLGNAFACGSASIYVYNSAVSNCATLLRMGSSASAGSRAIINSVSANEIGLTTVITGAESFGTVNFTLENCLINITGARVWPSASRHEYKESSVISILKTSINVEGELRNCIVTGVARHLLLNTQAIYGGLRLYACKITVTDYIATSDGWGASTTDYSDAGLLITADSLITISSATAIDSVINWNSKSTAGVFTRVRLNLDHCTVKSNSTALRPLISLTDPTGGAVIDFLSFPEILKGCYLTSAYLAYRLKKIFEFVGNQVIGLAGANTIWEFVVTANRPPNFPCLIIADDKTFIPILQTMGSYIDNSSGNIKVSVLLPGDVRSKFTVGNKYSVIE